ncbi:MAG: SAM-dependent methyltransferase, partial [Anaerolineales bacterium]|nr:SAM-dependent methyltransferase [Anaerolineales bacterium]
MNQHKNIIEGDRRLSQSLLWQIQRLYFERSGMAAWQDDVVPHSISSNPVMARTYSRVVWGYLRDCAAAAQAGDMALDPAQPIYIVELGAGSGRLAHHFLHQFHDRQANGTLAGLTVKYVMTDFVPQIVEFWQQQEKLQRWVDAGLLDFALFDVTDKRLLSLRHANLTLTPDRFANPPILIANYFFDSIPQDSFVIEDG